MEPRDVVDWLEETRRALLKSKERRGIFVEINQVLFRRLDSVAKRRRVARRVIVEEALQLYFRAHTVVNDEQFLDELRKIGGEQRARTEADSI